MPDGGSPRDATREDLPFEVSSADLNRRFGEIRRRASSGPVAVTFHGRHSLVLLSIDAFRRLQSSRGETGRAEIERRRLTIALDNVSEGYVQLDREWRVTECNRTAQLFVGRTRDEFIGRTIWESFPTAELDLEPLGRAMEFGEVVRIERSTTLHPERTMAITAFPLPGPDGGIGTIFANISERSRMLATVKSRTQALEHLLADVDDRIVFVVNELAQVEKWGAGAEAALGWAANDVVGQPLARLLAPGQALPVAGEGRRVVSLSARDGRTVDACGAIRSLGAEHANIYIMTASEPA